MVNVLPCADKVAQCPTSLGKNSRVSLLRYDVLGPPPERRLRYVLPCVSCCPGSRLASSSLRPRRIGRCVSASQPIHDCPYLRRERRSKLLHTDFEQSRGRQVIRSICFHPATMDFPRNRRSARAQSMEVLILTPDARKRKGEWYQRPLRVVSR